MIKQVNILVVDDRDENLMAVEGRPRVPAEVVSVAPVDRLQQEAGLDVLELGRDWAHLYSHTRISDSNWSTSTGFVM